ncbi:MAG TPA: NADPH-dependent F420 reductase [Ktedonobacteraceae bacterium]|nr:NADPH-dependent F420 reductase [Ktedonobacteraceae bacterium]
MNIGILGAGRIGETTAELFAKAGHSVAISNSKGPASLTSLVEKIGSNARAVTAEEAVKFGDIVLIAVPWTRRHELPDAQLFENKITIDATNPYGPHGVEDLGDSTSSELISQQIPGARLVKAFNTMYFETLRSGGRPAGPDRLVLFIAGDDTEAKEVVARLIEDIGFAAVDTGFLREGGRLQQPGSSIYNVPITVEEAPRRLADLK